MRTTMNTVHRNIITNLNNINYDIEQANNQISSGLIMSKISDAPTALVSALSMRSTLAEINQYQENLNYGSNMISAAESSLTQMKELVMRAKVLGLQNISGAVTQDNRLNTAAEVSNLFEQAIILANTQINGKYIFGGYRTAGYTAAEPAPFAADQVDGHLINSNNFATMNAGVTATLGNTANISNGDLTINGESLGLNLTLTDPLLMQDGLNMGGAFSFRNMLNAKPFGGVAINATMTTLYAGAAATANTSGGVENISFDLNGVSLSVAIPDGSTANDVATLVSTAVNAASDQTGVRAFAGNGSNGGVADSVVFRNILAGDESAIDIANLTEPLPPGAPLPASGIANSVTIADSTHNTGQVTMRSPESFTIESPNNTTDDDVLNLIGMGGGGVGFADDPLDGQLTFGHRIGTDELKINGYTVGTPVSDGVSSIFADISATAKAEAINNITADTNVSAVITPPFRQASGTITAGTIGINDLVINGVNIFDAPATVLLQDSDNTVIDAINSKSGLTGIVATRDLNGILAVKAIDGRNMQIRTSAIGESITRINGGTPAAPQDKVYFGALQLTSERSFILETPPTAINKYEPGLEALGLAGGILQTGEGTDVADDGKLSVLSITQRDGVVRYNGDRENDIEIKVGKRNTLEITKNGQDALVDTGLFSVLKKLEDNLRAINYTSAIGIHQATDVTQTLDSGKTGLPGEDQFSDGSFTVTVTDHAVYPPKDFAMTIEVDASVDSLTGVAAKIHGIPGMYSYWDTDGYLQIGTTNPDRYTYTLTDHTSNFLEVAGITQVDMQVQGLDQSIQQLDDLLISMTSQISDFGARVNRIEVQEYIFSSLEFSTKESLSETQDTDIVEAMMEIKKKEVAYQAALSAAARSMKLSLVDYL